MVTENAANVVTKKVEDMLQGSYKPTWKNRRRVIFLSLLFCGVVIGFCVWDGGESEIREVAVAMSFVAAITIIGSYVFGSNMDTKDTRSSLVQIVKAKNGNAS